MPRSREDQHRIEEIERLGGNHPIAEKYKAEIAVEQVEAAADLKSAMDEAKRSADRYAKRLFVATWVLIILTIVLVLLTALLAIQALRGR